MSKKRAGDSDINPESKRQKVFTEAPAATHTLHPSLHHPLLREWQAERTVKAQDLIYPLFIVPEEDSKEEITSLPGQFRLGINHLSAFVKPLVAKGLRTVLLFGVLQDDSRKDDVGSFADAMDTPVVKAIRLLRKDFPGLVIACDVCLCPYTASGHCGIMRSDGTIDNVKSIARMADIAAAYGSAGCHIVAPSDMMDGRIHAMKERLISLDLAHRVSVMSYSAKFASSFYGPFRDAAKSAPAFGDRRTHQLPPSGGRIAIRAMERDIAEGADYIMVKPGLPYLDIIAEARRRFHVPIACYQVSGEFAMLWHAAQAGAMDLRNGVMESLNCLKRGGCDIIITYYTPQVLDWLSE